MFCRCCWTCFVSPVLFKWFGCFVCTVVSPCLLVAVCVFWVWDIDMPQLEWDGSRSRLFCRVYILFVYIYLYFLFMWSIKRHVWKAVCCLLRPLPLLVMLVFVGMDASVCCVFSHPSLESVARARCYMSPDPLTSRFLPDSRDREERLILQSVNLNIASKLRRAVQVPVHFALTVDPSPAPPARPRPLI